MYVMSFGKSIGSGGDYRRLVSRLVGLMRLDVGWRRRNNSDSSIQVVFIYAIIGGRYNDPDDLVRSIALLSCFCSTTSR